MAILVTWACMLQNLSLNKTTRRALSHLTSPQPVAASHGRSRWRQQRRSIRFFLPTHQPPPAGWTVPDLLFSSPSSELLAWSTGYTRQPQPPRTLGFVNVTVIRTVTD